MNRTRIEPGWGDRVRRWREALKWSQGDLAARAGTTQAQVSRIEKGRHGDVGVETVAGLADAFGVSVDALLGRPAPRAKLPLALSLADAMQAVLDKQQTELGHDASSGAAYTNHRAPASRAFVPVA